MKRFIGFLSVFIFCLQVGVAQNLDQYLASQGLVDVSAMDTTLRVDLRYATPDNIMGEAVYEAITGVWLHPDAAEKLLKAQRLLKARLPHYSLVVYDAARPMSVQEKMWNLVRGTDKTNYVSNPANGGGLHNYGMAVDLSIVDKQGHPISMGCGFDYFGIEAHINQEEELVQSGKITQEELPNRLLLRTIMRESGFSTVLYEWWHFNACSRSYAREHYPVIP
ncbi:MAG: M15 family metallopeptidase [Tannerellaceae bacterium]|nr:M15 family metallopeptidase [Tannerellaceae bacterium]